MLWLLLFFEIDPGAIPDAVGSSLQRLEDALRIQGEQIVGLINHGSNMMNEVMKLHAIRAAQQVPEAAANVVHAEGEAAGQLLEGAADVAASPAEVFVTRRHGLRRVREKQ